MFIKSTVTVYDCCLCTYLLKVFGLPDFCEYTIFNRHIQFFFISIIYNILFVQVYSTVIQYFPRLHSMYICSKIMALCAVFVPLYPWCLFIFCANSLSLTPLPLSCPSHHPLSPLVTTPRATLFSLFSVSVWLYALVCFIFQIPCISDRFAQSSLCLCDLFY